MVKIKLSHNDSFVFSLLSINKKGDQRVTFGSCQKAELRTMDVDRNNKTLLKLLLGCYFVSSSTLQPYL